MTQPPSASESNPSANHSKNQKTKFQLPRFIKFLLVGGTGTWLNLGVVTLTEFLGVAPWASIGWGYLCGFLWNYNFHRRITYRDRLGNNASAQFKRYLGWTIFALGLKYLLSVWLIRGLVVEFLPDNIASQATNFLMITIMTPINFLVTKNFVFLEEK